MLHLWFAGPVYFWGFTPQGLEFFGLCLIKKGSKGLCENLISFKRLMITVAVYLIEFSAKLIL
jgi:hypothetical protein